LTTWFMRRGCAEEWMIFGLVVAAIVACPLPVVQSSEGARKTSEMW
jgi:hypothetical protein